MSDGGGARATVELLLHLHSFRNIDLRSRGLFCVETVVFPHSSPSTPGVPFQTFNDLSVRRSSARGVTVTPVAGDVERPGVAGTSSSGMPAYTSSCLPIRFTNEHVELSEGASFRISVDADWLETDMISIEFRLLCRPLPDNDPIASPHRRRSSISEEDASQDSMKEVGKVTLYAKCASAKGGLHRFHPLVFGQPYLCFLDVTLHMALTAINHPGGPAGLAAAIVANAFPSEDLVGAPRSGISPAKASTPAGCRTRPRAATVGRCSAIDRPTPVRPRFRTPGRSRRRVVGGASGTIGWGGSYGNGGGSSSCDSRPRVPMTADALEVAATAPGLATALGYTPARLDADPDGIAREILRAAELLYSRHALGLKWSQGTLKVAEVAANSAAAEVAAAREAATAAAAAAAAKRLRARRKCEDAGLNPKGLAEDSSLDGEPAAETGGARGVNDKSPGRASGDSTAPMVSDAKGADEAAGTSADAVARREAMLTACVPKDSLSSLIQVRPTMWSKPEVALDADDECNEAWTWMPSSPQVRTGARKVPLPSDVRQLSRVIHRRLTEESTVCSRSWTSFASATFQCGRQALVTLREEWVEDTRRAWSGQSLEYATVNRVDLLKLEETFFESDGFLLLRARAGVRLRQHASPNGGGDEGVGGKRDNGATRGFRRRSSRRRSSQDSLHIVPALAPEEIPGGYQVAGGRTPTERPAAVKPLPPSDEGAGVAVSSSDCSRETPDCVSPVGLQKMKIPPYVLSPSVRTVVDGHGGGCGGEKHLAETRPGSLKSMETTIVLATTTGLSKMSMEQVYPWDGSDGTDGADCEEDDLDGAPPVLDVLERKERRHLSSSTCTPRGGLGGGGGVFTPKSCTSSSWGGSSPWRSGSMHRVEHGWFSRLTAGTGGGGGCSTYAASGGAPSPIGGGAGGFGASGSKLLTVAGSSTGMSMSATGSGLWTGAGISTGSFGAGSSSAIPSPRGSPRKVVMNLPPPPMSMLPVFDRKLHGYDPSGATEDRWGELPFVVVESWGGLDEKEGNTSAPDVSVPPTSPRVTLGANEFRLFREIATTSNWQASPTRLLALPKGTSEGGGNRNGPAVSDAKDTPSGTRARDDAVALNPKAVPSLAEVADGPKTVGKANGSAGVNPSSPRFGLAVSTTTATALPSTKVPPSPVALPPSPPSPPSSTRSRAPPDTPSRAPFADIPLVPPSSRAVTVNNVAAIGMGILTPNVMRDKQAPSPVRISLGTPTAHRLPSPVRMSSALSGAKHSRPSRKHERTPSRSPMKLHGVAGGGKQAARLTAAAAAAAALAATSGAAAAANKGGPRTPEKSLGRHQQHQARAPGITVTSPMSIWDQTSAGEKESNTKVHRPQFEIGKRPTGHRTTSLPPRDDAALSLQEDTDQGDTESSAMTDSSAATVKNSRSKSHGGVSRHRRNVHRRAKSSVSGLIARAESIGAGYFSDDFSDSMGAGAGVAGGRKRKGRVRRRTKRAEIRRRMWGKSADGATAPLALPAPQPASGATSAASATSAGESDVGSERAGAKSTPAAGAGTAASGAGGARGKAPSEAGANHLIVLVHGLGGRPADMALMRGYLQAFMPGAELMVATSLQDMRKDNLGVEALGQRLASEVNAHITRFCPYFASQVIVSSTSRRGGALPLSPVTPIRPQRGKNRGGSLPGTPGDLYGLGGSEEDQERSTSQSQRSSSGNSGLKENGGGSGTAARNGGGKGMLSFVCFSMGGLVTRSALLEPEMVPYLSSLQCFVTLACPHLGQTSTPLSFFKTGAWAVRKLTGLRVLHELDLDDAEDPRETALYRLSFSPGLERFRTIVFAANPRDGFVPLHSAAVRSPPLDSTSRTRDAASEMAEMLMSRLDERRNRVVRITVDDPRRQAQSRGTLDTVIGRAGHMCFIDSPQVAWLISLTLLPFMEEKR